MSFAFFPNNFETRLPGNQSKYSLPCARKWTISFQFSLSEMIFFSSCDLSTVSSCDLSRISNQQFSKGVLLVWILFWFGALGFGFFTSLLSIRNCGNRVGSLKRALMVLSQKGLPLCDFQPHLTLSALRRAISQLTRNWTISKDKTWPV